MKYENALHCLFCMAVCVQLTSLWFPPNRKGKRKVRRAGSTVFDHCIAAAAHRREGWIFTIPMCFDSALITVKRFDKWITEFSEDLAARGQVIDKDVEYEIYRVLSAPSEALVMIISEPGRQNNVEICINRKC